MRQILCWFIISLNQHRRCITDQKNSNDVNDYEATMQLYQHFQYNCSGNDDVPLFDRNNQPIRDADGPVLKHKSLCNMKCFIIDTVNPKTIYKFLIGAISYKRVLSELYYLEMKYQGETLAFIHGLNTYVDWNCTTGMRRGDGTNVRPDLDIKPIDYDNIQGLDQFLTREEFERLIDVRFKDLGN